MVHGSILVTTRDVAPIWAMTLILVKLLDHVDFLSFGAMNHLVDVGFVEFCVLQEVHLVLAVLE